MVREPKQILLDKTQGKWLWIRQASVTLWMPVSELLILGAQKSRYHLFLSQYLHRNSVRINENSGELVRCSVESEDQQSSSGSPAVVTENGETQGIWLCRLYDFVTCCFSLWKEQWL